jgi:GT2 family glycosyltransferase
VSTLPSVSLSIVSHGQGALVAALLGDIANRVAPPIEVLLTKNVREDLPFPPGGFGFPLRVIENAVPKGFGANHNAAFREARGRRFCVLNPDIRLAADPFPVLNACLESDATLAASAPVIVSPTGAIEDSARRFPTPGLILRKAIGVAGPADYRIGAQRVYPDWIAAMFLLFRREAFAAAGGFDERYFMYYEDVDLCARLRLAGFGVAVCPEARAMHDARRESHRRLRYLRWHLASMTRFFLSPGFLRLVVLGRRGA